MPGAPQAVHLLPYRCTSGRAKIRMTSTATSSLMGKVCTRYRSSHRRNAKGFDEDTEAEPGA